LCSLAIATRPLVNAINRAPIDQGGAFASPLLGNMRMRTRACCTAFLKPGAELVQELRRLSSAR